MNRVSRAWLIALGLILLTTQNVGAATEPSPLWKVVGTWEIRVDRTLGYGCFVVGSYLGGSFLRLGFDRSNKNGYVMVTNDKWRSLEVGKDYPLALRFDNDTPWRRNARAIELGGGTIALYLPFGEVGFLSDFARKQSLYISYGDKPVTSLRLTGTVAAVQALLECQEQIEQAPRGASDAPSVDPFATGRPQRTDDPFK